MIRLDGNSLAAFRGAGVAGTVQSVAGCELFGAARMPSWASPYSAAATQALKAAFSADQWATIRDYGFSHPEIVPYMNAYAPEDAKIAYSLVEGIGTRGIRTDKSAYIDTGIKATSNTDCQIDYYDCVLVSSQEHILFGARNGSWSANYGVNAASSNNTGMYAYYNYDGQTRITPATARLVKLAKGKLYLDGVESFSKTYSAFSFNLNIYIFGTNNGGTHQYSPEVKAKSFKVWVNDELVREMYPFIRNGVNGMIDVLSGTFYQNAGSGSFTISETPAS